MRLCVIMVCKSRFSFVKFPCKCRRCTVSYVLPADLLKAAKYVYLVKYGLPARSYIVFGSNIPPCVLYIGVKCHPSEFCLNIEHERKRHPFKSRASMGTQRRVSVIQKDGGAALGRGGAHRSSTRR